MRFSSGVCRHQSEAGNIAFFFLSPVSALLASFSPPSCQPYLVRRFGEKFSIFEWRIAARSRPGFVEYYEFQNLAKGGENWLLAECMANFFLRQIIWRISNFTPASRSLLNRNRHFWREAGENGLIVTLCIGPIIV
ncbi:hypothetical protein FKM82_030494 [Ascaphus truei]